MLRNTIKLLSLLLIALPLLLITSCKDDEPEPEPQPTTGVVKGVISDYNSGTSIDGATVSLFDANTNEPTGDVLVTDTSGNYKFIVAGGNYFLKLSGQGYNDIPNRGMSAIPFKVTNGSTLENSVQMVAHSLTNVGWISGNLSSSDADESGCLVVAVSAGEGYSTISDSAGNYIIYNVPTASYSVQAWKAEISSNSVSTTVTVDTETSDVNLSISKTSGSTVSGSITFLATQNADIDVALTHPETEESIPGLSTVTSGGSYSIGHVSNGMYLARATYANDGIVMDPDWIVKNGEPYVTVSSSSTTRDFSVTGAVALNSPTNDASSTVPVPTSSTPTFEWTKYSSTSDYVIEVQDSHGNVIWGGFSSNWTVKNIVIPSSQNSIEFNSDGNASSSLNSGEVYRWKVYASKDNSQSATGWELISVSEDQRGLIIID